MHISLSVSILTTSPCKSLFGTHLALYIPAKSTEHYHHTLLRKSFSNFQQEEEEKKKLFQSREMNPASHVSWDAWGPFKEWFISRSSIKREKRASEWGMKERQWTIEWKVFWEWESFASKYSFLFERYKLICIPNPSCDLKRKLWSL